MTINRLQFVDEMKSILLPLLAVTITIALGLKALDFLPAQIERIKATILVSTPTDRILRFDSLEEAEDKLGVKILVPAYFPDYLIWPAASVYAQHEPLTVTLIFRSLDLREDLLVRQSFAKGDEPLPLFAEPFITLERSVINLDEQTEGILIEGKDIDGAPRNQLYWTVQDRHISLVTPYPVFELLRMAESIHAR